MKTRTEVSAGGVVYRLADNGGFDVVLILTHEGRWQLPKGWVEAGEQPREAAIREAREEGGVHSTAIGEIDVIDYWFRPTYEAEPVRIHKFVHFFLLRYEGGSTDDHDDEVQSARWVSIDEAASMLAFDGERGVLEKARDALKKVEAENAR
jgi:8-oxo-dGTP pyrophosphatase MutT (NUDIX family)